MPDVFQNIDQSHPTPPSECTFRTVNLAFTCEDLPDTLPEVAPVTPPEVAPVTPPEVAPVTPTEAAPLTPPEVAPVSTASDSI